MKRPRGGQEDELECRSELLTYCMHVSRLEDKTLGNKERACILTYIHGQEERRTVAEDFSQWRTLCCFPPRGR